MKQNSRKSLVEVEEYVKTFAAKWKPYFAVGHEFRATIYINKGKKLMAAEFYPAHSADMWNVLFPEERKWRHVLKMMNRGNPTIFRK